MKRSKSTASTSAALAVARGLNAAQAAAITAIIEGGSLVEAAEAAGVDRKTLYRWRTHDPRFMATLDSWRAELRASVHDRLNGLAGACTSVIEDAIEKGDVRVAMRLVERLGIAKDTPPVGTASLPSVAVYDGFMVRCVTVGENRADIVARLTDVLACPAEEVERLLGDGVNCQIAGPYNMRRAEEMASLLRESGGNFDVVKVQVSYHHGDLPADTPGEILPADGRVIPEQTVGEYAHRGN